MNTGNKRIIVALLSVYIACSTHAIVAKKEKAAKGLSVAAVATSGILQPGTLLVSGTQNMVNPSSFALSSVSPTAAATAAALEYGDIGDIEITNTSVDNSTATTMYTISASGKYFLGEDITISPANNNVTYIKITVDNVNLNLNGFSINQAGIATGTVAIQVAPGLKNIIIRNGSLCGIRGTGIKAVSTSGNEIRHLFILSIDAINCTNLGVSLAYVQDSYIAGTQITGCNGSDPGAPGAIGLSITNCNGIQIRNSNASNNKHSSSGIAAGFYITDSETLLIENCALSRAYGSFAYGLFLKNSACITCKDTSSTRNQSTGTAADSSVYGFYLENCQYVTCVQCAASGQRATATSADTHAHGFYSTGGTNNVFDSCLSSGNIGGGYSTGSTGSGFTFTATEQFSAVAHSTSAANFGGPGGTTGTGYGFKLGTGTTGPKQLTIEGNYMAGNRGAQYYGYKDCTAASSTLLQKNISFGHGKVLPLTGEDITDTGTLNYWFNFPAGTFADKILQECSNADLTTISDTQPHVNLSVYIAA